MKAPLPEMLHGRKASDIFLEFSGDFINAYIKNTGNVMPKSQQLEEIMQIPWVIWNAYAFNGKDNIAYLGSLKLFFNQLPPEPKRYAEDMVEKRKTIYSKYKYGLGKYTVTTFPETGEINLNLESVNPDK